MAEQKQARNLVSELEPQQAESEEQVEQTAQPEIVEQTTTRNLVKELPTLTDSPITVATQANVSDIARDALIQPVTSLTGDIAGLITRGVEATARTPLQGLDTALDEARQSETFISDLFRPRTEAGQYTTQNLYDLLEFVNQAPAGYAGLLNLALTQDIDKATETVEEVKRKGFGRYFGDWVMDLTDSPFFATVAETSPAFVGSFLGGRTALRRRQLEKAERELDLLDQISRGESGPELSQFRLTQQDPFQAPNRQQIIALQNRIKSDPEFAQNYVMQVYKNQNKKNWQDVSSEEIEAIRQRAADDEDFARELAVAAPSIGKARSYRYAAGQEWGDPMLGMIQASSVDDIDTMLAMLDTYEKGYRQPEYVPVRRPLTEVGEQFSNRVDHLIEERNAAGKQVNDAATNLRGKFIDYGEPFDNFIGKLEEQGVVFNDGNPITDKKDYQNIDFEKSPFWGSPESEKLLRRYIKRMTDRKDDNIDAADLHNMKKQLPFEISTAKKKEGGLVSVAEMLLNDLRGDINTLIGDNFGDYRLANQRYSSVMKVLDKLNENLSSSGQINWQGVDKANVGLQSRKLLSNYANATDFAQAITGMDNYLKSIGVEIDDDLFKQVAFNALMERRLGAYGMQTLMGQQEGALKNMMDAIPTQGTGTAIVGSMGKLFRKVKAVDNDNAIAAIRDYLIEAKSQKRADKKAKPTDLRVIDDGDDS